MQYNPNQNHPKKGSRTTVEPIRRAEDINNIRRVLSDKPRDLLLFTLGTNNGIRGGDLLRLKVGDMRGMKPGDYLKIRESKTGKDNILMVNKTVHKVLTKFLDQTTPKNEDFLFKSRKGENAPLTIQRVNLMVKGWCSAINLEGNYGAHSLRKTFGYIQRVKYGVGFEILCKRFNHSSPAMTMRYLGIEDKEINGILMNEI